METRASTRRPPAWLGEKGCLAVVADLKRVERRNSARLARHLAWAAELATTGRAARGNVAPYEVLDGPQLVGAEIALALALSPASAVRLVNDAVAICATLEDLLRVVEAGALDWYTLVRIHDRMSEALTPGTPAWGRVHRTLAAELGARPRTHGAALAATDRAIAEVDPAQAAERCRRARKDRHITSFPSLTAWPA